MRQIEITEIFLFCYKFTSQWETYRETSKTRSKMASLVKNTLRDLKYLYTVMETGGQQ